MTPKIKIILGIVLAIVVIGLAWWFLGSIVGGIASAILSLLGLTKRDALKRYVASEIKAATDKAATDAEANRRLAQVLVTEQQLRARNQQQAATDKANTDKTVNGVNTRGGLDAQVDQAARELKDYLDKEDGWIKQGLNALILLVALLVAVFVGPSIGATGQQQPTAAEKARAKQLIDLLKRAKRRLQLQKKLHALAMHKQQIEFDRQLKKLEASIRACQQQKLILSQQTTPPLWPHYTAAVGATAAICLLAFGIREGTRGRCP